MDLEDERDGLRRRAYRMLGDLAAAEDAVQETYLHWYRMDPSARDEVVNPAAWLNRALGRICLDQLRSARVRRETYVGPWLPEPLPAGVLATVTAPDPTDRVTLDESVSTALLLVLEAMTPPERVAFVLHDVFAVPFEEVAGIVGRSPAAVRQLASSARRHVRAGRTTAVDRRQHDRVVRDFAAACATGDLARLTALLDPAAALRSDGGGRVTAARKVIRGGDAVARFLVGVLRKAPSQVFTESESADGLCLVSREDGRVRSVTGLDVRDGRITDVWIVLNPDKLTRWT